MSAENDFMKDLGYELPPDAVGEVQGTETFVRYQHPIGVYTGFVGKMVAKYQDLNGKSCMPDADGAKFHNWQLPIWILKYLGSATAPANEEVISPQLVLPDRKLVECYYPVWLSVDPKDQWTLKAKFEKWELPGLPQSKIIVPDAKKPTISTTKFTMLPAYYGMIVQFAITSKIKKDGTESIRYVDGTIDIMDYAKRIPKDLLAKFEADVNAKVEAERQSRQDNSGDTNFTAPDSELGSNPVDDFIF